MSREKKILIGFTGRTSSMVAAYLLKKQGMSPMALGIEFFAPQDRAPRNHYHLEDMDQLAKTAKLLDIPFFATSGVDRYCSEVLRAVVAARLAGRVIRIGPIVTKMIVEILMEKAQKLKAQWVATGHQAKVLSPSHGEDVEVLSSDEGRQAHELSLLDRIQMKKLLLPLDQIRPKEIQKIAQALPCMPPSEDPHGDGAYWKSPQMSLWVQKSTPPSLRKKGEVYRLGQGLPIGVHRGIHLYYPGGQGQEWGAEDRVVEINPSQGQMVLATGPLPVASRAFCRSFRQTSDGDTGRPLRLLVKTVDWPLRHTARVFFQNNAHLVVEFDTPVEGLFQGETLFFFEGYRGAKRLFGQAQVFQLELLQGISQDR